MSYGLIQLWWALKTSARPGGPPARALRPRKARRSAARGRPRWPFSHSLAWFTCNFSLHVFTSACFLKCITYKKHWFTCKTCEHWRTFLQSSTIFHFLKIFAKFRKRFIKIEHNNGSSCWKIIWWNSIKNATHLDGVLLKFWGLSGSKICKSKLKSFRCS